MIKDVFLNKISYINSIAIEYGFVNGKELAKYCYSNGVLSFNEKEEIVKFINMRNLISHGGSDRINVFDDDIKKLDKYIVIINSILGVANEPKQEKSDKASVIIYNLLKNNNGRINVKSFNNHDYDAYLIDDNYFSSDKALRNYKLGFEIFDVVIELLKKEGGKAIKGSCRGENKLGDEKCNKHTVSGAIGYNYFMKEDGESVFDTVHLVTALLDYAGICENKRGYLILK